VRAQTAAQISAKVMGYVREVRAQAGDSVAAGQTLIVQDARDLEAGLQQARGALAEARAAQSEVQNGIAAARAGQELAEATEKRMARLFAEKSVTNQEFDEAQMRAKVARAQVQMATSKQTQLRSKINQAEEGVKQAEIMRGYAEIKAPFAGVVVERRVEPGNLAAPGMPLLVVEQAGAYRLEASVEESKLASIKRGQPVTVVLDAAAPPIAGRVGEIVPSVDAASRSFLVKINLPAAAGLRSGSFGRALFPSGTRKALTVPAAAVREQGQLAFVFVPDNGTARSRMVTLGARGADGVEVLSGLQAGDKVIAPLPPALADGSRVETR
jgi:RND family efflux transporter MFP subunit